MPRSTPTHPTPTGNLPAIAPMARPGTDPNPCQEGQVPVPMRDLLVCMAAAALVMQGYSAIEARRMAEAAWGRMAARLGHVSTLARQVETRIDLALDK